MRDSYSLYRPGTMIRDFYEAPSSYYRGRDVRWSPFTPIGVLAAAARRKAARRSHVTEESSPPVRIPVRRTSTMARTPVFPAGFSLAGISAGHPTAPSASLESLPDAPPHQHTDEVSGVATTPWRKIPHLSAIPTKYTLADGVQADWSSAFFTFAKLSLAVLVVFGAVTWSVLQTNPQSSGNSGATSEHRKSTPTLSVEPSSNNVAQSSGATSPTWTKPVASTSRRSSTAATSSTPTATSTPATTTTPGTTGGMGAGPITSTPVTSTTPTTPTDTGTSNPTTPTDPTTDPLAGLGLGNTQIGVGPITVQL